MLLLMGLVVAGLHVIGFVTLIALVAPHRYRVGTAGAFTVGIGITAYTLGLRHAFDADHISAIDNTTRKLMSEGKRPLTVGFWFSLGHSTIVFALSLLLTVGIKAIAGPVENGGSGLHQLTSWIGTLVSGSFLYLIAALNLVILFGIIRVFREMRTGRFDEAELERQLDSRGLMNRFLGRLTKSVTKPWQMYPIGLLFGLGFDTATEVSLLVLAGGAAGAGLPWYAILCLPILFAAGMSVMDAIDGSFMNFAYGWAFSNPVRKIFYNLTITGLSVAVALVIGTIELGGLAASELHLSGPVWNRLENVDLNLVGFAIAGMFVAAWALALTVWRFGRIEERWSIQGSTATSSTSGSVRAANPGTTSSSVSSSSCIRLHPDRGTTESPRDRRDIDFGERGPWPLTTRVTGELVHDRVAAVGEHHQQHADAVPGGGPHGLDRIDRRPVAEQCRPPGARGRPIRSPIAPEIPNPSPPLAVLTNPRGSRDRDPLVELGLARGRLLDHDRVSGQTLREPCEHVPGGQRRPRIWRRGRRWTAHRLRGIAAARGHGGR